MEKMAAPAAGLHSGDAQFDTIVVGAGIVGTSTAYNLAKKGQRCLLLEQFPVPHTRGSSHGGSRCMRKGKPGNSATELLKLIYKSWEDIQEESGQVLFRKTGELSLYPETEAAGKVQSLVRNMRTNGFPHEVSSGAGLSDRYCGILKLDPGHGYAGVLDEDAGVLLASKAVNAILNLFKQSGGVLRDTEEVIAIEHGHPVVVRTARATYTADNLVLCGGDWTGKLLKMAGLPHLSTIHIRNVSYGYHRVKDGHSPPSDLPILCWFDGSGGLTCFCMPCIEYPGLYKVCKGTMTQDLQSPEERDLHVEDDRKILDFISEFIRDNIPFLDPKAVILEKCHNADTPDRVWILDRHPKWANVLIAGPFCGIGFKYGPLIGQQITNMVTGGEDLFDMDQFSLNRFATNTTSSKL